jgi:hypothetical protein
MKHSQEVFSVILPAGDEPAGVVKPSKESLHFPAMAVSTHGATVLGWRTHAVLLVGSDHLDGVVMQETIIQLLAVVGEVSDHALGRFRDESVFECGFDELCFMRRSAGDADGDRKTMAVDDRHDLGAFSPASRADSSAPFLALLKLASIKVSDRSSLPRSRRSSANRVSRSGSSPSRRHCWKRRWQV